jgi:hypothetical protein
MNDSINLDNLNNFDNEELKIICLLLKSDITILKNDIEDLKSENSILKNKLSIEKLLKQIQKTHNKSGESNE